MNHLAPLTPAVRTLTTTAAALAVVVVLAAVAHRTGIPLDDVVRAFVAVLGALRPRA